MKRCQIWVARGRWYFSAQCTYLFVNACPGLQLFKNSWLGLGKLEVWLSGKRCDWHGEKFAKWSTKTNHFTSSCSLHKKNLKGDYNGANVDLFIKQGCSFWARLWFAWLYMPYHGTQQVLALCRVIGSGRQMIHSLWTSMAAVLMLLEWMYLRKCTYILDHRM